MNTCLIGGRLLEVVVPPLELEAPDVDPEEPPAGVAGAGVVVVMVIDPPPPPPPPPALPPEDALVLGGADGD